MSRVQKGGAVFKPVAKARPRPATVEVSRQASIALDVPTEPFVGIPRPPTQASVPIPDVPYPPTTQPITPAILAPADQPSSSGSTLQETESHTAGEQRRKRQRSAATPDDDDDASSTSSKAKGGRGRRSRAPSLPPYDPSADPGEDLDPTVVTMATLCNDTGQGRVSSKAAEILNNHAAWKKQNREKRARMRELMEARKYGRSEQEAELLQENGVLPTPSSITPSTSHASTSASTDDPNADFDYTQDLASSRYNVQVRIGPNGETVIDEDSLVVNREETDETANYTHVTESDTTKFVNSGTYAKRFRGSRWSAEETELFYDALMQHGENYELIAYMLPGRDRKSCKNKFKVEDKRSPARINYCLNNRTAPDIEYLSRMTGKDFSGPVPEIRAPPKPAIINPPDVPQEASQEAPTTKKKRRTKTPSAEEGLVIIGDADAMGSESS
ncbi:hypothetical protein EST38_g6683 [Candolleomyces aberdarensis]|uniref:Uncharacterized protein n=1 Tax=Candolleomyces aberdarensis TaxID=2316362 RepID=A0A4Q2DJ24_9AGAR|nr:hypothetical protein EST38_g6683 [Candolleomyces aberdarensis]